MDPPPGNQRQVQQDYRSATDRPGETNASRTTESEQECLFHHMYRQHCLRYRHNYKDISCLSETLTKYVGQDNPPNCCARGQDNKMTQ